MGFEDFAGAHQAVLWSVFGIALIMGAVVNKTNFCTMGAVSDLVNMGDTGRFRAWIFAMAVAIIGVIILEKTGAMSMDITRPPYRSASFAWPEYLFGGFLFGIGMTLGSGCGNKTLIRIGGGNIKSIIVLLVIAVFAYFMVNPFPGTDKTLYSELFYPWTNPLAVSLSTRQDLGSMIGAIVAADTAPAVVRTWVGAILAGLLLIFVFKSSDFRGRFDNVLGGLVVGLAVLAAWYATGDLTTINADGETYTWTQYASNDVWDMMEEDPRPRSIGIQSFTFINPAGETLGYAINGLNKLYVTFGVMALSGVIAGSFLWALISGGFRFEWFASVRDFITHLFGGTLMGIGGVLGLGCTIGQGITGVSTLAIGSFTAFAGIVFGSALTMKIQYYKMVYEDANFFSVLLTSLVDMRLLPGGLRTLEAV